MADEPINDPKLEMLLLDSLCEQAKKSVRSYDELMRKMTEDLLAQAMGLAKLFLQANPHVVKLGFETTEGEFNDNGYDGYSINGEAILTHPPDLHIPHTHNAITGEYFCTYEDHVNACENYLAPNEWDYDRVPVKLTQEETLIVIADIFYAVSDTLSARYGTGLLHFNKDGLFIDPQ